MRLSSRIFTSFLLSSCMFSFFLAAADAPKPAADDVFQVVSDQPLAKEMGLPAPLIRSDFVDLFDNAKKIVLRADDGFVLLDRASKTRETLGLYRWGLVSPDLKRILPENTFEVMNLDGSGRRRLVETEDDVYVKTAWMPDGDILLIMAKSYEEKGQQSDRQKAVLTRFRLTDSSNSLQVVRTVEIQVDPLNNAILFSPKRDKLAAQYSLGSPRWVKIVDLNTMAETQLPDEQRSKTSSVLFCWSPDEKYLAYQTGGAFYIADMKGGRTKIDMTNCLPVAFTSDSKFLLVKKFRVFRRKLEYCDLYMVGLDGRVLQNLTRNPKVMEGEVFLVGDDEILYTDTTNFRKEYFRVMRLKRIEK